MEPNEVETQVLSAWRAGERLPPGMPADDDMWWTGFALHLSLLASRLIRSVRLGDLDGSVVLKSDGSPVSALEHEIEERIAAELRRLPIPVALIGEETRNGDPGSGITLAVDPVDGTWSLVNRTEMAATSLAFLRDGRPFLGLVANPSTAEIAYAIGGARPRLLQLGAFGEPDRAVDLPIPPAGPDGLLVNLHPQRATSAVANALERAWHDGKLDMLRSSGGAPSLGLLEAAKGAFVYVNLWNRRDAAPWDLWAGLTLLRAAGGQAIDLHGNPVCGTGHRGPFVAALSAGGRERVAALINAALNGSGS